MRMAIDGLVLREMNSGENDKRLLVLTAEKGKIWICAKGGRSIKSNKSAICRAFTYAEFEIYEKNNMFYLSGGSPNKAFFAYKTDLDGYALACYVTAICEEITGEEAEASEALRATLNTFYAIENQLYPIEQMKAAYELFCKHIPLGARVRMLGITLSGFDHQKRVHKNKFVTNIFCFLPYFLCI